MRCKAAGGSDDLASKASAATALNAPPQWGRSERVRGLACGVEAARRVPLSTKVATARHENRRLGGGRAVLNRPYDLLPGLRGSTQRVHRKMMLAAAGGRSEPTHRCPRRRRGTSEVGLDRVRLLQPRARGVGTVDEASPSGGAEISASEFEIDRSRRSRKQRPLQPYPPARTAGVLPEQHTDDEDARSRLRATRTRTAPVT